MKTLAKRILKEQQGGGAASVWAEVTSLAKQPNVIADLGQGYPDFEGSKIAIETAANVIKGPSKDNQYSLVSGHKELRESLSSFYGATYSRQVQKLDVEKNILVTTSATEALCAAVQAIVDEGDEVLVFEPYFPWYLPMIRMAGGKPVIYRLDFPEFKLQENQLEDLFNENHREIKCIIFNTPHNPSGRVFSEEEVKLVAKYAIKHNCYVISDEVYENYTFSSEATAQEGNQVKRNHFRMCDVEGMWERTVTISSAAKMLSLTGWRVGWAYGCERLISALKTFHVYSTYCAPTPLQLGVAAALAEDNRSVLQGEMNAILEMFQQNLVVLKKSLETMNITTNDPEGGYFLIGDVTATGLSDIEFVRQMASKEKGMMCVPMSVFYQKETTPNGGTEASTVPSCLVRFSICKTSNTVEKAVKALLS